MARVYSVYSCGPTLGGRVAIFDNKKDANTYARSKNEEHMFSPTAVKDEGGISKAWLMGDGQYYCQEENSQEIKSLFDWY